MIENLTMLLRNLTKYHINSIKYLSLKCKVFTAGYKNDTTPKKFGTANVSLNVRVWFGDELSNSSISSYTNKGKRWRKALDSGKGRWDFFFGRLGLFLTRIFNLIFTGFSDFSKVLDIHLGISKFFSQKGHLDFSFSPHELVVDIVLLLSISFCQKYGA